MFASTSAEVLEARDHRTLEEWVGMVGTSLYRAFQTPRWVTSLSRKTDGFWLNMELSFRKYHCGYAVSTSSGFLGVAASLSHGTIVMQLPTQSF